MLVPSPSGARIAMSQLASIKLVDGPTIIQRQEGKRQVSVRTNIRDRDQSGFVAEAKEKVLKKITIPKGYSIMWGGVFENLEKSIQISCYYYPGYDINDFHRFICCLQKHEKCYRSDVMYSICNDRRYYSTAFKAL